MKTPKKYIDILMGKLFLTTQSKKFYSNSFSGPKFRTLNLTALSYILNTGNFVINNTNIIFALVNCL